jgi:hypothetical protein
MKKLMVVFFVLAFFLASGCVLFFRDRAHDDHRDKAGIYLYKTGYEGNDSGKKHRKGDKDHDEQDNNGHGENK